MSRFSLVTYYAKKQRCFEQSTQIPSELYRLIWDLKGGEFAYNQVTVFNLIERVFWQWFRDLEKDLCLVLKN